MENYTLFNVSKYVYGYYVDLLYGRSIEIIFDHAKHFRIFERLGMLEFYRVDIMFIDLRLTDFGRCVEPVTRDEKFYLMVPTK